MKFSTILSCCMLASTSLALAINQEAESAHVLAPRELEGNAELMPERINVNINAKGGKKEKVTLTTVTTITKKHTTETKSKTIVQHVPTTPATTTTDAPVTTSDAASTPAQTTMVTSTTTSDSSAPTSPAGPVYPAAPATCGVKRVNSANAVCNINSQIQFPSVEVTIENLSLNDCTNLCMCAFRPADCRAFSWNSKSNECIIFNQSLQKMGIMGSNPKVELFDRGCFATTTVTTATSATMTMGSLATKVVKRTELDNYILGALMGI